MRRVVAVYCFASVGFADKASDDGAECTGIVNHFFQVFLFITHVDSSQCIGTVMSGGCECSKRQAKWLELSSQKLVQI